MSRAHTHTNHMHVCTVHLHVQVYIWRVDRQADRRTGGEADRRKDRQTDMHECSQHAEQPELKNVLLRTANAGGLELWDCRFWSHVVVCGSFNEPTVLQVVRKKTP